MSAPVEKRDPAAVTLGEAHRVWVGIGLRSFGGPTAQIALMHRVLVVDAPEALQLDMPLQVSFSKQSDDISLPLFAPAK